MKNVILVAGLSILTILFLSFKPAEAVTVVLNNSPSGTFEVTPGGTNPSGLTTSTFNLQTAFQALFGSPSPNFLPTKNMWGESPTQLTFGFDARGDNVKVDSFQELDFDIFGDYWTLDSKLTFDPSSAIIVDPNDHILWGGTLQHTGKLSTNDFPHEGDDKAGPPMKFSIDLSAGDKKPDAFGQLAQAADGNAVEHPSVGHADGMIGILQARVTSPSIFFDEIEGSYSGLMVAFHLGDEVSAVPEPTSLALLACGIGGWTLMRRKRG